MKEIEKNEIGLTRFAWTADGYQPGLTDQLDKAGIPYEVHEIPHLVGMGGSASLIFFRGTSGEDRCVLFIPIRYEIDGFAEEYYYFDGMSKEKALESEQWWLDAYERCKELTKVQL